MTRQSTKFRTSGERDLSVAKIEVNYFLNSNSVKQIINNILKIQKSFKNELNVFLQTNLELTMVQQPKCFDKLGLR